MEQHEKTIKCEIYNDSMQNWKKYPIQKAQLIIADVPYNVGTNFYGSNPMWYNGGDNSNGESKFAGKAAFASDFNFNLFEYFHFCSQLMRKEPARGGERGKASEAPCMIVFCSFEQMPTLIKAAEKHGFIHNIPLIFCKNYSPQVLKANMRIMGATEYALLFYRSYLPKFNNGGKMQFNWFDGGKEEEWGRTFYQNGSYIMWERDKKNVPKIHPTQKPVAVIKKLVELFTDEGDVVIDPCFGSGSTGRACMELKRSFFGFEINKEFYNMAKAEMLNPNYVDESAQIEGQMNLMEMLG